MKYSSWILTALLIYGCATYKGVGSEDWYKSRLQEIEISYANSQITKADYIRLKNEADAVRASYLSNREPRTGVGFHYGILR
jgi:hypothetical protein